MVWTPVATGACCLEDGSCEDGLTEVQCDARQGIEWHEREACDNVDCPQPGGCNGNEFLKATKCKTRNGAIKKLIVIVKRATPGEDYDARLDTGQQVTSTAKGNGKAKFKFKGGEKPPCGENAVTVSTDGERCLREEVNCQC